jgi:hypothetical protein
MSIASPTSPGRRWLEQGQSLAKLKAEYNGNWLDHYNDTLRHTFNFAPRSEQLCRQLYALYMEAVEEGDRVAADQTLAAETRVNDLVAKFKALRQERRQKRITKWLAATSERMFGKAI